MKRNNEKEFSFWHFLSQHKIVIPKIQRDYAQGRKDKSELRKAFLKDIKVALESCNNTPEGEHSSNNEMKMDFVYGSEKNNVIEPLDGQQRLTTLWLLHWYIALRAGKLNDESVRETLKNFTYQTRASSRAFCEQLCDKGAETHGLNLQKSITLRTWFCSAWLQDPTIQAMLRMLCGTRIKVKENKEQPANDGIAQVFVGNSTYFERIWAVLTSETCPIRFYYLDLLGLKLTDDLYIKMNARGKPLSSFENFKADLSGYLAAREKEDKDEWKELNNMESGYPIKLDTSWAEIFWKANKGFWKSYQDSQRKKVEFRIDDPYFIFLNRIILNLVITEKSQEGVAEGNQDDEEKAYLFKANEISSFDNQAFNYLYGKDVKDDTFIEYTSFDYYCYKPYSGKMGRCLPKSAFETIQRILDNLDSCNNDQIVQCFPERHKDTDFEFIPVYNDKDGSVKITPVSQTDRVVFFSICKYFEQGKFEGESFRKWMRVVWNIVDAVEINTIDGMVARMRRIDKIAEGSHDIYKYFCECVPFRKNGQLEEERIKAKAIMEEIIKEDVLMDAENYSFFSGSIRFLYQDGGDGNPDWEKFEQKKEFAKKYLTKELTESKDANLMKKLFSYMTKDSWDALWKHRVFNNKKESWRYFLLNEKLYEVIDAFLLDKAPQLKQEPIDENTPEYWLYYLSHGGLLDFVMKRIPESWINDYRSRNHMAIYPSAPGVFLNAKKRDCFFDLYSEEVKVKNERVEGTKFLYGNDVNFEFQGKLFQWNYKNEIWSIDESENQLQKLFSIENMESKAILEKLSEMNK